MNSQRFSKRRFWSTKKCFKDSLTFGTTFYYRDVKAVSYTHLTLYSSYFLLPLIIEGTYCDDFYYNYLEKRYVVYLDYKFKIILFYTLRTWLLTQ